MKSSRHCCNAVVAAGAVFLGLFGTWTAAAEEDQPVDALAEAVRRGTLEFALYADFPPYSYGTAEQPQGIDADIARAIAHKLELKLKVRLIPAGESASDDLRNHLWKGHYLGGGVADVMLHVGIDPVFSKRERNVVFFEPYFHESVVLAYQPGRISQVESPLVLAEHRIAVEGDTISDHIMSGAFGGALRNSAVREQSLEGAVESFKKGDVDAVMGPWGELQGLMAQQGVTDVKYRVQESIGMMRTSWDVGVAVKETGNPSLYKAIAHAMDGLKADGSMAKMFAAHGVKYAEAVATAVDETGVRRSASSQNQR